MTKYFVLYNHTKRAETNKTPEYTQDHDSYSEALVDFREAVDLAKKDSFAGAHVVLGKHTDDGGTVSLKRMESRENRWVMTIPKGVRA